MLSPRLQKTFRSRLHQMRRELDARLSSLRAEAFREAGGEGSGEPSIAPTHLADLGNQELDAVVNLGLANNEANLRQNIDAALARLEEGTFGICEQCGCKIKCNRLEAIPYTALCMDCAEKHS